MTWTIQKLLQWGEGYFKEKGIESARLDAEILLAHAVGLSRIDLYTQYDRPLIEAELQRFKPLVKSRAARQPLAYLLGEKEFFSLNFKVNPAVLIPRPETEDLVELGLNFLGGLSDKSPYLLDLATGSGCILLALLKNFSGAQGVGVDRSREALEVSQANAHRLGLTDRCTWIQQDLREEWAAVPPGPFDLMTANLPYVSEQEWKTLAPEIREFEPADALIAGPEGTEVYLPVLTHLPKFLKSGGRALLEIGAEQGPSLLSLAGKICPGMAAELKQDLSGHDRILQLKKK